MAIGQTKKSGLGLHVSFDQVVFQDNGYFSSTASSSLNIHYFHRGVPSFTKVRHKGFDPLKPFPSNGQPHLGFA